MNNYDLNISTNYILKLASMPDAQDRISFYLDSLLASYPQSKDSINTQENSTQKAVSSIIYFTHKEIEKMAKSFKKAFIANGLVAHITKRVSSKNTICYEIRYRANGYDISASSTDLKTAKAKFLSKTTQNEIDKYRLTISKSTKDAFESIFEEWHQVKKGTISEKEVKRFKVNFDNLPEDLRKMSIKEIRTADLDAIMKGVAPRKYEELRTLFNGIFKYAIASGIITNNPIALIPFKRAERINRENLSQPEILSFLERITEPKYDSIRQGAYLLYFFGLRPCEVDEETRREGDFLITRNRKRKNGKIEYKKIPIPSQAQGLIDWDKPLTFNCTDWKRNELFNEILEPKTAYSLRHTFSTLCQEAIHRVDVVDIWMGDSPERLVGRVYTHFSDAFMIEQMAKVNFPILPTKK